jgi:putative Ca2+/H+ antiporter (TMEM165/GDT1 family)
MQTTRQGRNRVARRGRIGSGSRHGTARQGRSVVSPLAQAGRFPNVFMSVYPSTLAGACLPAPRQTCMAMDFKILLTVFTAVFLAELGDKTQLATMLFAADKEVSKLTVFVGASLALIVASAMGVLAGSVISQYVSEKHLNYLAGAGFIVIGVWTLVRA